MLKALRTRAALRRKAGEIYGAIVTQARREEFYGQLGIPDIPAGRYDMVVLHLFLVLERLRGEASGTDTLQRLLIEAFVADMDDSLRELGTGDIVVGKRVRRAAAGFYERARDYRAALAEPDAGALELALVRLGLVREGAPSRALAAYVSASAAGLKGQGVDEMLAGPPAFARLPPRAQEPQ